MTFPVALPDWLPWWVPTIALVLLLLWALAFLLVPFSVIGLKSRLDGIEARLDEIQAEIRTLVLRLPDPVQPIDFDELYTPAPPEPARKGPLFTRPPIPPATHELEENRPQRTRRGTDPAPPARPERTEPRLGRPR
jgi:hypothetical protein